jgi:hypothetical protein
MAWHKSKPRLHRQRVTQRGRVGPRRGAEREQWRWEQKPRIREKTGAAESPSECTAEAQTCQVPAPWSPLLLPCPQALPQCPGPRLHPPALLAIVSDPHTPSGLLPQGLCSPSSLFQGHSSLRGDCLIYHSVRKSCPWLEWSSLTPLTWSDSLVPCREAAPPSRLSSHLPGSPLTSSAVMSGSYLDVAMQGTLLGLPLNPSRMCYHCSENPVSFHLWLYTKCPLFILILGWDSEAIPHSGIFKSTKEGSRYVIEVTVLQELW